MEVFFFFSFYMSSEDVECWQDLEPIHSGGKEGEVETCDAEILDELTTSRGELKLRSVSFPEDRIYQVSQKTSRKELK